MNPKKFTFSLEWKEYIIETWRLAQQTNWSCTVQVWETVVLATACMARKASDVDFLPLSVSYQERFYASWIITSNRFRKREWRPADDKVLMARLLDRGIRPLFPKWFNHETQVMITTLSYDGENEHDTASAIAASVALSISDIPFLWPNVLFRVWIIDWKFVLNPLVSELKNSDMDLSVTCTKDNIVMIEAWANIVPENVILEAMEFAFERWKKFCDFIEKVAKEVWKQKVEFKAKEYDKRILPEIEKRFWSKIEEIIFNPNIWKLERFAAIDDLKEIAVKELTEVLNAWVEDAESKVKDSDIWEIFWKEVKYIIRKFIIEKWKRIKWRKTDEIRKLSCEVWILPRTHGSWVFNRWETQWLSLVTLWWPWDKQIVEWIEWEKTLRYMHHYNFPPFSVWEVSNRLSTWNREIWHWALAERALIPVLPAEKDFPYTIRVVTEILSSNGSSSMAATCWSTLALMDAWVPIKAPVAWIAMWLMTDLETWKYQVLTDLQDEEDFGWDMDFKVAWTSNWVTAIQMDTKLTWVPLEIFKVAFAQAHKWRMQILTEMSQVIPAPREHLSKYSPKLISWKVSQDEIRIIIWKWWETINKIIDKTWVKIDFTDDWFVVITAKDSASWHAAQQMVELLIAKPEVWKVYEWKVVKIMEFGAFVQFMPWIEWLVHISMLKDARVAKVEDVVKEWDTVKVKLTEIDSFWRYKLSMKDAK